MRKIISSLISVIFILCFTANIKASSGRVSKEEVTQQPKVSEKTVSKKEVPKPSPREVKQKRVTQQRLKRERELLQRKKKALNNTEWDIEVFPLTGKGKKTKDTLVFKDMKIFSKALKAKKFPPTDYSLHINQDGTLVWETMQTSEKGELVFWRGEITPDMRFMKGVFTFPQGEKSEDFGFRSIAKRILAP